MARLLKVERKNDGTTEIALDIAVDKIAHIVTLSTNENELLLADLGAIAQAATSKIRPVAAKRHGKKR